MYTDNAIVDLFWERNEDGIDMLQKKYGKTLTGISFRILNDRDDSEECVNDTYLSTWNSIPEARPASLLAYTGKIVRNISIDRLRKKMSKKRGIDNIAVILSELGECVVSDNNIEEEIEYQELSHDISIFLKGQTKESRCFFVERYWCAMTIKEIANKHRITEKKVESNLYRCRKKMRDFLIERGYSL